MGAFCSCVSNSLNNGRSSLVAKEHIVPDIDPLFKTVRVLGEGASCEVRECVEQSSQQSFALKRMSKNKMNLVLFEREVSILRQLTHTNIIKLHECYEDPENYYIVTALCTGGELFDRIVKATKFTEKIASKLIKQMLLSIQHCHRHSIAHRDLKPENFVFEAKSINSDLILIDFGCARKLQSLQEEFTDIVGTPYYLAPEYLRGKSRSGATLLAADIWAIGVISYILVTGQPPFNGKNNHRIFLNIVKQNVKWPKHVKLSDTLKDFILLLLNKDPSKRPDADTALQHPFINVDAAEKQGITLSDQSLSNQVVHFLSQFNNETRLKKKLAEVVIHYAPKKDIEKLKRLFESVDKDGDGQLTVDELAQILVSGMGYYATKAKEQAQIMMQKCDEDGDGKLSFEEFSHVHASMQLSSDEMLIHTCFKVMDEDNNGSIELTELQNTLKLSQEEAREIFEEVDLNNDGVISFDEFKIAMNGGLQAKRFSKSQLFAGVGARNDTDNESMVKSMQQKLANNSDSNSTSSDS